MTKLPFRGNKGKDHLHDKLMQINSHNVSCLFKSTLSKNATEALCSCDDEFNSYYCYSDQEPDARYVDWKPSPEHKSDDEDQPCDIADRNRTLDNKSTTPHELPGAVELEMSIEILRNQLYNIKSIRLDNDHLDIYKEDSVRSGSGCTDNEQDAILSNAPNLTDFYRSIRIGPEERFPKNHICGWRVCRGGHLQDLDPMLLEYHSENDIFSESTRRLISKRQHATLNTVTTSGERVPFGVHPFLMQAGANSADDRALSEKMDLKNANQNAKFPTKSRKSASKNRAQKNRSKSAKNKGAGNQLEKSSMQELVDSPINYKFKHNSGYRTGYIQQYREQYTTKKLQHILLQCAERYYASKQQQPVARAAVQCTDVREGACLVNDGAPTIPIKKRQKSYHGQKPLGLVKKNPNLIKVSQYRFDMAQKLRTDSLMAKHKQEKLQRPRSSSVVTSPCVTPVEITKEDALGPFSFSLTGKPKNKQPAYQQTSLQDLSVTNDTGSMKKIEDSEEKLADSAQAVISDGTDKQSELEQAKTILTKILRGGSPIVSRSRPTIPSNSRGLVYASSVETPIHIVTGTKPLLRGKKKQEKVSKSGNPDVIDHEESGDQAHDGTEDYGLTHEQITLTSDLCDEDDRPHNVDAVVTGLSYYDHSLYSVSAPVVNDAQVKTCSRGEQHKRLYQKSESEGAPGTVLLLPKPQVPKTLRKKNNTSNSTVKKIGRIDINHPFLKK